MHINCRTVKYLIDDFNSRMLFNKMDYLIGEVEIKRKHQEQKVVVNCQKFLTGDIFTNELAQQKVST